MGRIASIMVLALMLATCVVAIYFLRWVGVLLIAATIIPFERLGRRH
jgi:hypothetical protein